ncbi:hypothetical protein IWX90DRAFT_295039 [Phyllosticta citrichinensis]|uniref:Uncharacterized protein n=1 Tax=Phyllosticta citrichinensis TaxID=1130410 RepID=A0ABR1XKH8_9PEZI
MATRMLLVIRDGRLRDIGVSVCFSSRAGTSSSWLADELVDTDRAKRSRILLLDATQPGEDLFKSRDSVHPTETALMRASIVALAYLALWRPNHILTELTKTPSAPPSNQRRKSSQERVSRISPSHILPNPSTNTLANFLTTPSTINTPPSYISFTSNAPNSLPFSWPRKRRPQPRLLPLPWQSAANSASNIERGRWPVSTWWKRANVVCCEELDDWLTDFLLYTGQMNGPVEGLKGKFPARGFFLSYSHISKGTVALHSFGRVYVI